MDYRLLMLADPEEIKRILDEFGGRSMDREDHQPGWVSKLITRVGGTVRQWIANQSNVAAKKETNDDEQPVHP